MPSLPTTLWPWQLKEIKEHGSDARRAIFADPRTGKTFVAVLGMMIAQRDRGLRRFLVTGPNVVCMQWEHEWLTPAGLKVLPAYKHGSAKIRKLLQTPEWAEGVLVINDDLLAALVDDLIKWAPEGVVDDESHRMAGVSSLRARAFRRLAWRAQWVRELTGTPAPNHYGSLWGQLVALDKDTFEHSYGAFKDRYLIVDSMFPSRVLGHKNVDQLQERLLRYATIVRRSDVFGPDHYQAVVREFDLPPKVAALYEKLAREWIIDAPVEIVTDNVLVRMLRLQQIACGFLPVKPEEMGEHELEEATDGFVQLHSTLQDNVIADLHSIVAAGEKSTLFHRFRYEGAMIEKRIRKEFPKLPVFTINGGNSSVGSQTAAAFNAVEGAAVCIVQTQSGGVGISLRTSKYAQILSQYFKFDDEKQALDRIYATEDGKAVQRIVHYYRAAGTIHDYIATVLEAKRNVHDSIQNADRQALAFGNIKARKKKAA